jgi:hypothetical protein
MITKFRKGKVHTILLIFGSIPFVAYGAINCIAYVQNGGPCGTPIPLIVPPGNCYVFGKCGNSSACGVQDSPSSLEDCQDAEYTATAPVAVYSDSSDCTQLVSVFNDNCDGGPCYKITSTTPCGD